MAEIAIGLDFGARRIGVARGDSEVRIAAPLAALLNDETVFAKIHNLVQDNQATRVVIGLPRDAKGQETEQSRQARAFAAELAKTVNPADVEIILQDESLTSVQAERNLSQRRDFQPAMLRDGTLDSEAAALILTDYLEKGARHVAA